MTTKGDVVTACQIALQTAQALPDGPIPPDPPIPPVGPIVCAGFGNTIVLDIAYTPGQQTLVNTQGQVFGPNDIVVVRFTTASVIVNGGFGGSMSCYEFGGLPCQRYACMSNLSCDFTPNTAGKHGTPTNIAQGTQANLVFGPANNFTLLPNTLYYFNIKNGATGQANNPIQIALSAAKVTGA